MEFSIAAPIDDIEPDTVPDLSDVEYPCEVCGKEAGPYGGRGRKPKRCSDHKKQTRSSGNQPKVTGSTANIAAQATQVLVQLNGMLALGSLALGLHKTAGAIAEANPAFETAAYNALLTDPELCKFLLKSGAISGKAMLVAAYGGMGLSVAPTAVMEVKEKREARRVRMENDDESRS